MANSASARATTSGRKLIVCDLLMRKRTVFRFAAASANQLHPTKIIIVSGSRLWRRPHQRNRKLAPTNICQNDPLEHLHESDRARLSRRRRRHAQLGARSLIFMPPRPSEILGRGVGFDPGARVSQRRLWRQHQLRRSARPTRDHYSDAGSGMREPLAWKRNSETGQSGSRCSSPHTLGSHSGAAFFPSGLQGKEFHPRARLRGARAGLATILAGQMETSFFQSAWRDMRARSRLRS